MAAKVVFITSGTSYTIPSDCNLATIECIAAGGDLDVVPRQHGRDLPGDLACGQVAFDSELGRQAELAVDGASDLAGDTNGGALPLPFGPLSSC